MSCFIGGGGAGRTGAKSRRFCVGGFGAGLLGIMRAGEGAGLEPIALAGRPFGIGGGARGFSKLPSWF